MVSIRLPGRAGEEAAVRTPHHQLHYEKLSFLRKLWAVKAKHTIQRPRHQCLFQIRVVQRCDRTFPHLKKMQENYLFDINCFLSTDQSVRIFFPYRDLKL